MAYLSITEKAHQLAAEIIEPGDSIIDATAGNGHDTLALANMVGRQGNVIAFDIQASALAISRERLHSYGLNHIVKLILAGHEQLDTLYPKPLPPPRLILFNLGYLPGGDKTISTDQSTTIIALEKSWEMLSAKGRLIVVCYPGHPAGAIESQAVETWFEAPHLNKIKIEIGPTLRPAPYILYADK